MSAGLQGVLLPATMKVLGDWNWYLPSRLEWLPRIGAERDEEAPTPPAPPVSEEPRPTPVPA